MSVMFDPCPLVLSPTGQSGLRFKVIIFSIVLLAHGVALGFAWMHRTQRLEQKTHTPLGASFFESFLLQPQLAEVTTKSPSQKSDEITPAVISQPEKSLPDTEYQVSASNQSEPGGEQLKEANSSKKVSVIASHRHAVPRSHKHEPDISKPAGLASYPHNEIPPSSHAHYSTNPQPPYPKKSRRLGEQGKVVLAVEVDHEGRVSQIQLSLSSGYPRLDHSALEAVRSWQFIPGKKAGTSQKMWVTIPINFVLE